jgi:flavin reductase (DIM6/NTAB) family NADH-FMN oxidoreductase RutF
MIVVDDALNATVPAASDYRKAMRRVPEAVTVVTTATHGGRQGLTVTAVSSVSAEPPQLLVCINRETRSAAAISAAGHFGVNYLETAHVALAAVFAAPTVDHEERFRLARWVNSANGTPLLEDALIAFDCCVVNEIHSGTHTIFIGQVTGLRAHDGEPLLFQRGAFTTTTDPSPGRG